ncbi:MAG TPA: hypothetical protein VEQ42_00520 [Pyrinomonadaceae bacterium]|nr:hypothetical protein [Pyrinomonadaceae bacterium]
MRNFGPAKAARVVASAAFALAFVLLSTLTLYAQARETPRPAPNSGGRQLPAGTRPVQPHEIPSAPPSVRSREFTIRAMEHEAARPLTAEEQKLAMGQIAEDYREIQKINNQMMAAAMKQGAALDYAAVSRVTSEIGRRAARLRQNIVLPRPDALDKKVTEQKADDEAQLKKSLRLLDQYLMSFVGSPLFKNPDVFDAKAAAKAGQDLASVIELSQLIKAGAEKLGQPSSTSK